MTVYVDKAFHEFARMKMCHMLADTPEELHAMAKMIGIARRHYQAYASTPHYDVCKAKRAMAVNLGAQEINRSQLFAIIKKIRTEEQLWRNAL